MTLLLSGHAVKVGLASTNVTAMRGSIRLMKRAQVAPAKPPPTTTARPPVPWPMAGSGSIAAAAPAVARLRNSRRLLCIALMVVSVLLRPIPGPNGFDLVLRKTHRDAIHAGRNALPRF